MNDQRIEEIREFLNQPDDVYEAAPGIALELLAAVDKRSDALRAAREERKRLRELLRDAVTLFECDDECFDPSTAAWAWLQSARMWAEFPCTSQ